MQKHLPEWVQKGQGTMRAFTFENATKIYFGGGCVKEHLLEAVKAVWGNGDAGIWRRLDQDEWHLSGSDGCLKAGWKTGDR